MLVTSIEIEWNLRMPPDFFFLIAKEHEKTQYLVLFERNTALAMYGAGEGNRTLIISLEG